MGRPPFSKIRQHDARTNWVRAKASRGVEMAAAIENRLSLSEQEPAVLSNPEADRAPPKLGRRAVVVGAGIGGLRDGRGRDTSRCERRLEARFDAADSPHLGLRRVALCAQPDIRQMQDLRLGNWRKLPTSVNVGRRV
jgi:hypothetical protein